MGYEDQLLNVVSGEFTVVIWALVKLVLFAMLLERALYFIFDYSLWRDYLSGKKIKAPITLAIAWYACSLYDFDIISPILDAMAGPTTFGIFLTSLIIAGGSAGAMILFQDVLNLSRESRERIKAVNKVEHEKKLKDMSE